MLLEVSNVSVWYDKAMLINNVSMGVDQGELVSLVGPNGAGKSTLLRTITGLVAWEKELKKRSTHGEIKLEGQITFDGERIDKVPAHEIVRRGLILAPERRRPFKEMTVIDNLMVGAYLIRDKANIEENLEKVYQLFPVLKERSHQVSGTLSGGEQQMLAVGRALMSRPTVLLLDEPSLGLAPRVIAAIFGVLDELRHEGLSILLVEQDAAVALRHADRGYVMRTGRVVRAGTAGELLADDGVREIYLGPRHGSEG